MLNPLIQFLLICCFKESVETLALPVHSNVLLKLFLEVFRHLSDLGRLEPGLQRHIHLHGQRIGLVRLCEELLPEWLVGLLLKIVVDESGVMILHVAINVKIIEAHLYRLVRQSREKVSPFVLVLRRVCEGLQVATQDLGERGEYKTFPVLLDLPFLFAAVHGLLLALLLGLGPRLAHHGDRQQVNVRLHQLHIGDLSFQWLVLLGRVGLLTVVLHHCHRGLVAPAAVFLLVLALPPALQMVALHG
mmetsp:Transcript_56348/g.128107  ORF Transcript_56348/g.128107 Transcript_56348/m.128107 type:complete len:246 (-) Transcript_56348:305-1042(-)